MFGIDFGRYLHRRVKIISACVNLEDLLKMHAKRFLYSTAITFFLASNMLGITDAAAQDPDGDQALEEIIVLGTRRAKSLQDVPVAISVFDSTLIESANITRPGDFLELISNATFVQSNIPGEFYITLRGNTQTRLGESSVALVIDGVPYLDQNNINQEFFELEQIEVLKGPQGALYGRNAIGGAVVIRTRRPDFENWGGSVRASLGNNDFARGNASISGPLIPGKLAAKVSFSHNESDGSFTNELTGENPLRFDEEVYMGRLMATPSEALTIDLKFTRQEINAGGIAWNGMLAIPPEFGGNVAVFSGDDVSLPWVANIPGFSNNDRTNLSAKIDYETGVGTFTSITSYAETKDHYGADGFPYFFDAGLFDVFFPGDTPVGLGAQTQNTQRFTEIWFQEIRLTSPSENRFRWIVGAYYAEFDITNSANTGADRAGVNLSPLPNPFGSGNQTLGFQFDTNDNKAYAFYLNTEYDVSDRLEITASLRYDKEEKNQTDHAFALPPDPMDPKGIPFFEVRAFRSRSTEFDDWQPKVTARYTVNDDFSVYASWGRGFKTGGWNPFGTGEILRGFNPASTVEDSFAKEVADSWEIGFKGRMWDNRISISGAAFFTDTDNAQLLEFFPQATLQAISTADKIEMKGVEFDFVIRATEVFTLFGGVGVLDAEITQFASAPDNVGNKRPSTSPLTVNAGIDFNTAVSDRVTLTGRVDYRYQGKTYWDWVATPGGERSSFSLINARAAIEVNSWMVAVWGKNLNDKKYNAEHIVLLPGIGALFRAPERTYGVDLTYRF